MILQKMFSINTLLFMAVAFLALSYVEGVAINFQRIANTPNIYSSFPFGYVSGGTNITALVSPQDSSASYNILFWRPDTAAPGDTPFKSLGPFTGQKMATVLTDASGNWRVQVLPNAQDFIFALTFFLCNQSIGQFYGVASYGHTFTVYYSSAGYYTANLTAYSGSINDVSFSIFGPFSTLSVSGGTQISSNKNGNSNSQINYTTQGKQYFYITVKPNNKFLALSPQISLSYQTDLYQCPYNLGFNDANGYFQGCSSNSPTQGPPCISNDPITGYCTLCAPPFVANSLGVCVPSMNCKDNQYWHYGTCINVIDNCVNFQKLGGFCQQCASGYNLVNFDNGTQICNQLPVVCGPNQYSVGNICYNNVANCANFVLLNATCLACSYGYNLVNNSCVERTTTKTICPVGQIAVNDICQVTDPYCLFYGSSKCQLCTVGWKYSDLTNLCTKIICGSKQYSCKGFCDDVSPFCDSFDPIYGTCKSCIPFYSLQLNGKCVQDQRGSFQCPDGYYLSESTCVQVSPLCQRFDNRTGKCISCRNPFDFYLDNGICQNISIFCINQYRTYFSNGSCMPVSQLCNQYDPSNGRCITCNDQTFLDLLSGHCKYNLTCGPNQYYGVDGNCLDGNQNCTSVDQNTGDCLSCLPGFDLSAKTCCRHEYYLDTTQCIASLAQNCLLFNKIQGCNICLNGYSKPDSLYFTKCIKNSA